MLYICGVISQSEPDKRDKILQAALRLFAELGFHGTPTSKIAQAAGVANGTLFHYFKTKEELITCLYIQLKNQLSQFSAADLVLGEGAGIKEKSRWAYLNALHWALRNPEGFRFIQQFTNSPFLLLVAPEEVKRQTATSIGLITDGITAGLIKPLPPEFIHSLISSHIYGMNEFFMQAKLGAEEQETLMQTSFDMLWKMLT